MTDVDKIFLSFVNNKIDRETIYRIIAKIESKTNCINSLIEIINFLKTCQDTKAKFYVSTNLLKDLNIISPSDISYCYKILIQFANNEPSNEEYSCFSRLLFEPKIFIMNRNSPDGNDISFSPDDEKQALVVINSVIEKLNLYSGTILNNIQEACVKIIYSPYLSNYYELNNNTIVFTGSDGKANIVTGPILKGGNNSFSGIETRWENSYSDSILQHELGHYLRLYLENIKADNCFFDVGYKLRGFTRLYKSITTGMDKFRGINCNFWYNLFCVVFKESLLKLRFPDEVIYNKSIAETL